MGEMKYQRRRASCAATATCDVYGISNQISPISWWPRHDKTMLAVAGGGVASLSRAKEA